jgi:hypothetical protein
VIILADLEDLFPFTLLLEETCHNGIIISYLELTRWL